MKSPLRFVLPWLIMLAGGCALSPQSINIDPAIDTSGLSTMADGPALALAVDDNRGGDVLGTRGGVYAGTAEIRTTGDIRAPVRRELAAALETMGYRVVESGNSADADLRVIIDEVNYQAIGDSVVKAVEIAVVLRVAATVDNREYTGRYRGRRTTDVLTPPNTEKNETMINEALSHVLERVLTDSELHTFLRGKT